MIPSHTNVIYLLMRVVETSSAKDGTSEEFPVGWYDSINEAFDAMNYCNKALLEAEKQLHADNDLTYKQIRQTLAGKLEKFDRSGKPEDNALEYRVLPMTRGNTVHPR